MIKLEHFKSKDFEYLAEWIDNERDLVQFAGDMFTFPITETQIVNYLKDNNRYVFKVVFDWNTVAIKCYEKTGMRINKGITKEAKYREEKWIALNMSINKNDFSLVT